MEDESTMSEEPVTGQPPAEEAPGAQVACCAQPDPASQGKCTLCEKPICGNCGRLLNGRRVCQVCADKVAAELAAEQADGGRLPLAAALGVAAAVLGGAVWAAIVVLANVEVGYVAIGVGWLTAMAVVLGAGGRKGVNLQVIAVACAILGLLLGKYFAVAHYVREGVRKGIVEFEQEAAQARSAAAARTKEASPAEKAEITKALASIDEVRTRLSEYAEASYFSPLLFRPVCETIPEVVSFFDLLWVVLALGIAWRVPRPTTVSVK